MRASIHLAKDQELTDVQKFWYRIYVTEMNRHISDPLTDHNQKILHDPLTQAGNLFVARDASREIIATLMTTVAAHADLGKYEHLYGLEHLDQNTRERSSITTKLMVAPQYRRTRLPMLMAVSAYKHTLNFGVETDYIDCNDHLVGFFQKLGYQRHLGRIVHRDYGAVNSMALKLCDKAHLAAVASPFLKTLLTFNEQTTEQSKEASHAA